MEPLMKLLFMFLLGLAFAFKSSSPRLVNDHFFPTASPPQPGYDYFKLALQWPPTVNPRSKLGEFTIHGLWPDIETAGVTPKCCDPATRFRDMRADLEKLLHKSWPDVLNGNDKKFWEREWNMHGKCSSNLFNQTRYFELAHNLRTQHSVLDYLRNVRIRPGHTYQVQQIENAVRKQIGNSVINMQCNDTGGMRLQEIQICFNVSGKGPISCPKGRSVYGRCRGPNSSIYFPLPNEKKKICFPKAEQECLPTICPF